MDLRIDFRGATRRRIGNGSKHAYFFRAFNVEKIMDLCGSSGSASGNDISAVDTTVG